MIGEGNIANRDKKPMLNAILKDLSCMSTHLKIKMRSHYPQITAFGIIGYTL